MDLIDYSILAVLTFAFVLIAELVKVISGAKEQETYVLTSATIFYAVLTSLFMAMIWPITWLMYFGSLVINWFIKHSKK